MSASADLDVYDAPAWRTAGDGLIRPGGLALTDRAISYCQLPPGSRIWDIGCGLGIAVEHLVRRHGLAAVGIDRSDVLLDAARNRAPTVPFIRACADVLPCPSRSLDAVMAECSWSSASAGDGVSACDDGASPDNGAWARESASARDGACTVERATAPWDVTIRTHLLAEFHRVLRPDGWLILSDLYARSAMPAGPAPLGAGCWRTIPTEDEVRAAVASQGFLIELWEDHSAALREFAARLILDRGSLRGLWGEAGERPDARAALKAARPGYFLLIARRDG